MGGLRHAARRKHHFIYKTTCIITNKFYIGMHSTDNLEDGYIGSGQKLWHSINKHGKENHICEILEFLPDRKTLALREQQIVNGELLEDKMCMNLVIGGEGGFTKEESARGTKKMLDKIWSDPDFIARKSEETSKRNKELHANGVLPPPPSFKGKNHSKETKRKIGEANSIKQKGECNSQYGTCWITNGVENKKIGKNDSIPEGWKLGRKLK